MSVCIRAAALSIGSLPFPARYVLLSVPSIYVHHSVHIKAKSLTEMWEIYKSLTKTKDSHHAYGAKQNANNN